jgi:hypothetical protein
LIATLISVAWDWLPAKDWLRLAALLDQHGADLDTPEAARP